MKHKFYCLFTALALFLAAISPCFSSIVHAGNDKKTSNNDTNLLEIIHLLETNPEVGATTLKYLMPQVKEFVSRSMLKKAKYKILSGRPRGNYVLAVSPDKKKLASGDGGLQIWDVNTKTLITTLQGNTRAKYSVAFSPDNSKLASGSADGTVQIWDVSSWQPIITLQGHKRQVSSVIFSPDGSQLASAGDRRIRIWDARTGKLLHTLSGGKYTGPVCSVVFSPDGKKLAGGFEDATVRIWGTKTWNQIHSFYCTGIAHSVGFDLDSSKLYAGVFSPAGNKNVVWDLYDNQTLNELFLPYDLSRLLLLYLLLESYRVLLEKKPIAVPKNVNLAVLEHSFKSTYLSKYGTSSPLLEFSQTYHKLSPEIQNWVKLCFNVVD